MQNEPHVLLFKIHNRSSCARIVTELQVRRSKFYCPINNLRVELGFRRKRTDRDKSEKRPVNNLIRPVQYFSRFLTTSTYAHCDEIEMEISRTGRKCNGISRPEIPNMRQKRSIKRDGATENIVEII